MAILASPGRPQAPAPAPAIARPVRVLLLDDQPRWELRFVRTALARCPTVELAVHVRGEDPGRPVLSTAPFPQRREHLAGYDVLLLGDLELRLGAARDQDWMLHVMHFLDHGGGVAFLAGPRAMPHRYRGTMLERLLPVALSGAGPDPWLGGAPARLELPAGRPVHPLLRLHADPARTPALVAALPAVQSRFRAGGLADGAEALLVEGTRAGAAAPVVIAAGRWGTGRTLFVGTDETWRWRGSGACFATFWCEAVRALAGR